MKQIRKRLTYANVMSTLAVFLILGGATAFAASRKIGANQLKANSIKTGKIVKEAVTAGKIKKGAITESRIADGAVTTNKIANDAVTTDKIANDAVTTDKIANDAVTGDKVKESTLGQVPSAATATNAENLQAPEALHLVGTAGQPPFQNGFTNFGGEFEKVGFYLDRQCVVHVQGVTTGESDIAFTLPVGFRPAEATFSAVPATAETGHVEIKTSGTVELTGPGVGAFNFSLSGTTFRVAGC